MRSLSSTARRGLAALLVAALLGAACSSSSGGGGAAPDPSDPNGEGGGGGEDAALVVAPGVEQLLVTGAAAGASLTVLDADGEVVGEGTADEAGALLVRDLAPGDGYTVTDDASGDVTPATEVWAVEDVPDQSFYDEQEVGEGYQYVVTRDGTELAINVSLPGPVEDGPYPTVIEYSGYNPASPSDLQPLQLMANLLGYASVGVNMRGTGCSGGSFLFFEPVQGTDGYDVIEIIAAQDWVDGGVGMVGISYPGISQLFVAQTQPPSLAAITPLAVIEDTYRSTLYPGGILNNGFATSWAEGREADAAPAGQSWAADRIAEGDEDCEANQALRTQNADLFEFIEATQFVPEDRTSYIGRLAPAEWVDQIEVPVFLVGAWQDEQTGGRFPAMLDRFTSAPVTRFVMTNGGHTEALGPELLLGLTEFLDFYVAERIPLLPEGIDGPLGILGGQVFEASVELPDQRFTDHTSFEEARAAYEAEDPVRILFENGAGREPGHPYASFGASFPAWPIPLAEATTWFLGAGGALTPEAGPEATEAYTYDTSRAQLNTLVGGNPWAVLPAWEWVGPEDGTALAYATSPLASTLVMAGFGRVDLQFGSSAPDVDLQVTLSEIRPDGTEVYVQSGWLRASHRALDEERSTPLSPYHTHLEADAEPLPDGELASVSVELFPFAHVFRAGSQVRLTVDAPGGTRPEWRFEALEAPEGTTNLVGLGGPEGSRLTLPVLPGVEAPAAAPPCPSLRGQPCRPLVALANRAG